MKQMKLIGLGSIRLGGSMLLLLLLVLACNKDDLSDKSFTIGDELVQTSTEIVYVDTLSVNLSTVILDSVISSGTYRMLVGNNTDGNFGAIEARTYFEVTPPDVYIEEEAVFDSLTLVLGYDGYYYGDTLEEQVLSVYALSDGVETHSDGYLYNTSSVAYKTPALGQVSFAPTPNGDNVEVRLSDSLGKLFFQKIINNDDELASESSFLDYFPGIHLRASNKNGTVIGYSVADTNTYLQLHYHVVNFEREEHTVEFDVTNQSRQFNQVVVDRTGTNLESWEEQRYDISSNLTQEEVYVQGVTGVLTRIEFPSLNLFIELGEQASLLKAELVFEPVKNTYDDNEIPESTVLYQTDGINRLYTPIYDSDNESIQTGSTVIDFQYHENTSISFDLTNYLRSDFLDDYYDEDYGFLLGMSTDVYYSSLDRIILGTKYNKSNQPKLHVYYMLYD